MSGIEKLINRLDADTAEKCDAILADAERQRAKIIAAAESDAKSKAADIIAEADKRAEYTVRIAQSQADMRRRQSELKAKTELIDSAVEEALKRLESLDTDRFFEVMKGLIINEAQPGDGVIAMLPADAEKAPAEFTDSVNSALTNGKLTLAPDGSIGSRGAILRYGDIDINLTFRALLNEKRDEIKSAAGAILFPAEDAS